MSHSAGTKAGRKMLEIPSGTHQVPTGLNFHLAQSVRLPENSFLSLTGNNGVGKTTFVEHVLIPFLRQTFSLLYIAQDTHLQYNTMRSTLALLSKSAPSSKPELAMAWIQAAKHKDMLIIDEFDKYLCPEQIQACDLASFGWVISVSHLDRNDLYTQFAHGFALRLQKTDQYNTNLSLERLW